MATVWPICSFRLCQPKKRESSFPFPVVDRDMFPFPSAHPASACFIGNGLLQCGVSISCNYLWHVCLLTPGFWSVCVCCQGCGSQHREVPLLCLGSFARKYNWNQMLRLEQAWQRKKGLESGEERSRLVKAWRKKQMMRAVLSEGDFFYCLRERQCSEPHLRGLSRARMLCACTWSADARLRTLNAFLRVTSARFKVLPKLGWLGWSS